MELLESLRSVHHSYCYIAARIPNANLEIFHVVLGNLHTGISGIHESFSWSITTLLPEIRPVKKPPGDFAIESTETFSFWQLSYRKICCGAMVK